MKPGDDIIMTKWPSSEFAIKYCEENGLYVGCIVSYIRNDALSSYLKNGNIEFSVGVDFLDNYFKKNYRKQNLKKLLL